MATLQDYLGITALRDAWPKWKANVIAVNNQVTAHVAGTADKHAAQEITYTGNFTSMADVKAALDRAKTEIDTIVVNASVDPEVALARESSVKAKTFATIDGRLEESEQDFVSYQADNATSVKEFGAKGDGITDDTVAIQNAINSLPFNGSLLIPNSVFIVEPGQIQLKSNIRIIGTGTLKAKPKDYTGTLQGTVYALLQSIAKIQNVLIDGLTFDGNSATQTNRGRTYDQAWHNDAIFFKGGQDLEIRNCTINDFIGSGIMIGVDTTSPQRIKIQKNIIKNTKEMFIVVYDGIEVIISDNICENAGILGEKPELQGNGILLERGPNIGRDVVISGNIINTTSRKALYSQLDNTTIIGNTIINSNWAAISLAAGAQNTAIVGNVIKDSNDAGILVASSSGHDNVRNVNLIGNVIYSTGIAPSSQSEGILISLADNIKISNNHIENYRGYGVYVSSGVTDIVIDNNHILSDSTTPFGLGGILIDSPSVQINDNLIRHCFSYGIRLQPTAIQSIIKGNEFIHIVGNGYAIHDQASDIVFDSNYFKDAIVGINLDLNAGNMGTPLVKSNHFINMSARAINQSGVNYANINSIQLQNNSYINCDDIITVTLMGNTNIPEYSYALNSNGNKVTKGSAIPLMGTWGIGDICYNTAPIAGGFIGWVCITAGTPGTWKTFGAITA